MKCQFTLMTYFRIRKTGRHQCLMEFDPSFFFCVETEFDLSLFELKHKNKIYRDPDTRSGMEWHGTATGLDAYRFRDHLITSSQHPPSPLFEPDTGQGRQRAFWQKLRHFATGDPHPTPGGGLPPASAAAARAAGTWGLARRTRSVTVERTSQRE